MNLKFAESDFTARTTLRIIPTFLATSLSESASSLNAATYIAKLAGPQR
jgi:hypothetical protein